MPETPTSAFSTSADAVLDSSISPIASITDVLIVITSSFAFRAASALRHDDVPHSGQHACTGGELRPVQVVDDRNLHSALENQVPA